MYNFTSNSDKHKSNSRRQRIIKIPELSGELVSFSTFMSKQDEKISIEKVKHEYEAYKRQWEDKYNEAFLMEHKVYFHLSARMMHGSEKNMIHKFQMQLNSKGNKTSRLQQQNSLKHSKRVTMIKLTSESKTLYLFSYIESIRICVPK